MNSLPNEEMKERNIERVLEITYHLFLTHGVDGTTKEMLVRASGVSRSSLDRYFENKLDLVLQTGQWFAHRMQERLNRLYDQLRGQNKTGLELLRAYLESVQSILYENPRIFALGVECRIFVFRSEWYNRSNCYRLRQFLGTAGPLTRIIEDGIRDGSLNPELDAAMEAKLIREITLGYFSSIALTGDNTILEDHTLIDQYITRVLQLLQRHN